MQDANLRIMVFLDGSNLFWGAKGFSKRHGVEITIDYRNLVDTLVGKRPLMRAIFYCSVPIPPVSASQLRFIDYLRKSGFQVVQKELKTRIDPISGSKRRVEKGVDVALATDLLGFAWENAYDVAIVVSGDADYAGAVTKVMNKGKNVEVAAFRDTCSAELKEAAIRIVFLDDIISIIKRV